MPAIKISLDHLNGLASARPWWPQPGPQTDAYLSDADVLLYGGAAGGGKSDLAIGLALSEHRKSIIFRREATQLTGIIDRLTDIHGGRDGYNGQDKIWRLKDGRQIEFGSTPNLGDETRYQGRPHDLIVYDEAANMLESQVRFLMGWLRSTDRDQRCRVVMTSNPPTDSDGRWLIRYFRPWLDPTHPNPAASGELRWYAVIDGDDVELDGPDDPRAAAADTSAQSRSFIAAKVADNRFLAQSGYVAQLQALPEPLRSQMLLGDFTAGIDDDPWQVVPTAWVQAAMDRWVPVPRGVPMTAIGVDPARGGRDETTLAPRYGHHYAELICTPGAETRSGQDVVGKIAGIMRNRAAVNVDPIGIGSSVVDFLDENLIPNNALNGASGTKLRDKSGKFGFPTLRSCMWWAIREALDPESGKNIILPPDHQLKADLCGPKWSIGVRGITVEPKDQTKKRIGRSPDRGDAVVYSNFKDRAKEVVLARSATSMAQHFNHAQPSGGLTGWAG